MRKIISLATTALAVISSLLVGGAPAYAAAPTISNAGSVSYSSDTLTFSLAQIAIVETLPQKQLFYACDGNVASATVKELNTVGMAGPDIDSFTTTDGLECYAFSSGGTTLVNVATAAIMDVDPQGYKDWSGQATHTDLVYASVVDSNNSSSYAPGDHVVLTASYAYTLPSAGTIVTQPTLSLSGTQIVATDGVWSGGITSDLVVFVCGMAQSATTTPSTSQYGSMCNALYASATTTDFTPATDLSTAYVSGSPRTAWTSMYGSEIYVVSVTTENTSRWVATASVTYSAQNTPQNQAPSSAAPTPYTGPIVNPPSLSGAIARGATVTLGGSNLGGVTKVEINGFDCAVSVTSDGELEITVPAGLAAGTYDLVVTSSSGKLTVQDGIRVSADTASPLDGSDVRPSSKKNEAAGEVKVRVFDVVGAGKVQIFVNGKEIAWVNATDASDPKLFDSYLVRTVSLVEGKTAIEVFVDGTRVQRWAYWM